MLSCSLFILELEVPPSSTLFFLLKTLLGKYVIVFFLFSNVVCISSLVFFKPWPMVSMDCPFNAQKNIEIFLPIPMQIDKYLSYPPYFP